MSDSGAPCSRHASMLAVEKLLESRTVGGAGEMVLRQQTTQIVGIVGLPGDIAKHQRISGKFAVVVARARRSGTGTNSANHLSGHATFRPGASRLAPPGGVAQPCCYRRPLPRAERLSASVFPISASHVVAGLPGPGCIDRIDHAIGRDRSHGIVVDVVDERRKPGFRLLKPTLLSDLERDIGKTGNRAIGIQFDQRASEHLGFRSILVGASDRP